MRLAAEKEITWVQRVRLRKLQVQKLLPLQMPVRMLRQRVQQGPMLPAQTLPKRVRDRWIRLACQPCHRLS